MSDHRIAVIADAHYHALEADWGVESRDGLTLRTWDATRSSTRVFNESHMALLAALDDIVEREIKHVVLLGDYSDDGQQKSVQAVANTFNHYTTRHGTQFFALPGNHDVNGEIGCDHTKDFIGPNGVAQHVTSDATLKGAQYCSDMYCLGQPAGLAPMAHFGFTRQSNYLHWETPFGTSDEFQDRTYEAASSDGNTRFKLTDASYLVEPVPGLWLMMIDANVNVPTGQGHDLFPSTNAGWSAMVDHKPFILDWMADVALRAKQLGKRLLTFSHYPVLDSYCDPDGSEARLFGPTNMAKRTPPVQVGEHVMQTGISMHFSGHLHVKRITQLQTLTNVAVPSLVAYPAAYCIAQTTASQCEITDVRLDALKPNPIIFNAYRDEAMHQKAPPHASFFTETYGAFLRAHVDALVTHRYVPREWPPERAAELDAAKFSNLARLARLQDYAPCLSDIDAHTVVADWYALRAAGPLTLADIDPDRCNAYAALTTHQCEEAADPCAQFWALFLKRLGDFAVQARTEIRAVQLPHLLHDSKASTL